MCIIETVVNGQKVSMSLYKDGQVVSVLKWNDNRDLTNKYFTKLVQVLSENKLKISDIENFQFSCDSPYFLQKNNRFNLENIDSSGKCGFTTWQTGEIVSETLNFVREI